MFHSIPEEHSQGVTVPFLGGGILGTTHKTALSLGLLSHVCLLP